MTALTETSLDVFGASVGCYERRRTYAQNAYGCLPSAQFVGVNHSKQGQQWLRRADRSGSKVVSQ